MALIFLFPCPLPLSINQNSDNKSLCECFDFIFEGTDDGFHYVHEESNNAELPVSFPLKSYNNISVIM